MCFTWGWKIIGFKNKETGAGVALTQLQLHQNLTTST